MISYLQNDNIEINSTRNEGRTAVAERFVRTLKNKIYKYMTSISKHLSSESRWQWINTVLKQLK